MRMDQEPLLFKPVTSCCDEIHVQSVFIYIFHSILNNRAERGRRGRRSPLIGASERHFGIVIGKAAIAGVGTHHHILGETHHEMINFKYSSTASTLDSAICYHRPRPGQGKAHVNRIVAIPWLQIQNKTKPKHNSRKTHKSSPIPLHYNTAGRNADPPPLDLLQFRAVAMPGLR